MTQHLTQHLSTDQVDDLLLGELAPDAASHLADCPACQARAEEFRAVLGDFNQASLGWAEARSNSISRDLGTAPATRPAFWQLLPAPALAFVLMLLFALVGYRAMHRSVMAPAGQIAVATETSAPDSASTIARDNALLADINSALDQPDPSPLAAFNPGQLSASRVATGLSAATHGRPAGN